MDSSQKVNVLFIAGNGRSGSTILDNTLGQIEGFHSIGENRLLWQGLVQDYLCGCNKKLDQCETWINIFETAFGGFNFDQIDEMRRLGKTYCTGSKLPYIFFKSQEWLEKPEVKKYIDTLGQLYQAIPVATGADWIVDSSKFALYAYLLAATGVVNLHFVHLIRDPRGVSYSWLKKVQRKDTANREYMMRESILYSSLKWDVYNPIIETFKSNYNYMRLYYEDFTQDPRGTVQKILDHIGESDRSLDYINGDQVTLLPTHTCSGNVVRIHNGDVKIKQDTEWHNNLKWKDRLLVNTVTLPLRLRYGY